MDNSMQGYVRFGGNRVELFRAGLGGYGKMYYLEIAGSSQLVRAVWANLVSLPEKVGRNQEAYSTNCDIVARSVTKKIHMDAKVHYITHRIKVADPEHKRRNLLHYAMIHPALTQFRYEVLMGGDEETPSPWFSSALSKIDVPVLPEWQGTLWKIAIANRLITRLTTCVGDSFWHINVNHATMKTWQEKVSEAVQRGVLKWQD